MGPRVIVDRVWKRFRRGERRDSLGHIIPALMQALVPAFARRSSQRRGAIDDREFWALSDVSFEVHPGEALGIIGRNGAGKSTILKLLTRILRPTLGRSIIIGRSGALIEVSAGFHPDLTGRENIYLQAAIMGMRRADIAARFDEIVEFAGVERFIDTPVKRYSSGMNARLGFSIAAHLNPDVLLIDEILAVGDMTFQAKCHDRMRRFRSEGVSIVFVSHQLPAVARLCDRVLLLERGTAVRIGPPAAVIADYCAVQEATGGGDQEATGGGDEEATGREDQEAAVGEDVRIVATLGTVSRGDGNGSAEADSPGSDSLGADSLEVMPGAALELRVTIEFRVGVEQAIVGIAVWDITRELYVYGASSKCVGVPPICARAGEARTLTFTFEANLTRGLYAIEVNVTDPGRPRVLAVARSVGHFHVVEQASLDGIANLYLAGSEWPLSESTSWPSDSAAHVRTSQGRGTASGTSSM